MKAFKYSVAADAKDACRRLGGNAAALAGGANLLNLMKDHVVAPEVVVDIKKIPDLHGIDLPAGRIGAAVTIAELLADEGLAEAYPVLHQAAAEIATPQIRNRGTVGGNLCARPACWYFVHESFDCAKKSEGQGCPAKEGENEFHAIFDTNGPCVSVHPSSLAPALLALDATVGISGPEAARTVPVEQFFIQPAADVRRENVLAPDEIVTHVTLGAPRRQSAAYQVRQKASHDWPLSLAAVALELKFGVCQGARIVLGGVAPVPRRCREAEAALVGKSVNAESAEAAARAAVAAARPLAQNAYKVAVARATVRRAVLLAGTGRWM